MTLEEAIKFNAALRNDLKSKGLVSYPKAIQLGIEAMKLVQRERLLGINPVETRLPSETEE